MIEFDKCHLFHLKLSLSKHEILMNILKNEIYFFSLHKHDIFALCFLPLFIFKYSSI
jgi:hypothetical protein